MLELVVQQETPLLEGLQTVLLCRRHPLGFHHGDCCHHQHRPQVCCQEGEVVCLRFLQGLDTMPTIAFHQYALLEWAKPEQKRDQFVNQILQQNANHTECSDNRHPLRGEGFQVLHQRPCGLQLEEFAWLASHRTYSHLQFQHPLGDP